MDKALVVQNSIIMFFEIEDILEKHVLRKGSDITTEADDKELIPGLVCQGDYSYWKEMWLPGIQLTTNKNTFFQGNMVKYIYCLIVQYTCTIRRNLQTAKYVI